jgi:hypothetical protein
VNWSLNKIAVQHHITEKNVGDIAAIALERGWSARESRSPILRDDYQRIADGMSYIELYLLGRPGEQVNRSNVAGFVTDGVQMVEQRRWERKHHLPERPAGQ